MILNYDNDRNKLHDIRRNFHFLLNVMEMAYDQEDHQTSMMIYLALIHPSVERLTFKRPKRMTPLLRRCMKYMGIVKLVIQNMFMTFYNKTIYDTFLVDCFIYIF